MKNIKLSNLSGDKTDLKKSNIEKKFLALLKKSPNENIFFPCFVKNPTKKLKKRMWDLEI